MLQNDIKKGFSELKDFLIFICLFLLIFPACIISLAGCSKNGKNAKTSVEVSDTGRGRQIKRIFSSDGRLWKEIPYKDGLKDGIEFWYYSNGNVQWEVEWENGTAQGMEKEYYQSGSLMKQVPWKSGVKNGWEERYDEWGKLTEKVFWKNDRRIKNETE